MSSITWIFVKSKISVVEQSVPGATSLVKQQQRDRGGVGDSMQRSGPANTNPMLNYKRADKVLFAPRDTLSMVSVLVQMPLQQQSFFAVSVNLIRLLFLAFSIVHYRWPLLQDAARVFPNKQIRAFYRDRPGSRARLPHSASQ